MWRSTAIPMVATSRTSIWQHVWWLSVDGGEPLAARLENPAHNAAATARLPQRRPVSARISRMMSSKPTMPLGP
jgi:hypothetical protein